MPYFQVRKEVHRNFENQNTLLRALDRRIVMSNGLDWCWNLYSHDFDLYYTDPSESCVVAYDFLLPVFKIDLCGVVSLH